MAQVKTYPRYLYHKEHNEPKMVENKAQETELRNLGWVARYLWREFPKMVNGIIVNSKGEEKLLLDAEAAKPKVEVKKTILDASGNVLADTGDVAPIVTEPPLKNLVQVTENLTSSFEMLAPDGNPIPDLWYSTWKEAQAAQKDLNVNVPGHKARKLED